MAVTVTIGNLLDGGTDIPVEELGEVGRRGAYLDLLDTQVVAGADEVVAVVAPLLVVVAGDAATVPHTSAREIAGGDVDNLRMVGVAGIERQIEIALMGMQVDRGVGMDFRTITIPVVEHSHLMLTALRAFQPHVGTVGEGVGARGTLLGTQIHGQHHCCQQKEQRKHLFRLHTKNDYLHMSICLFHLCHIVHFFVFWDACSPFSHTYITPKNMIYKKLYHESTIRPICKYTKKFHIVKN